MGDYLRRVGAKEVYRAAILGFAIGLGRGGERYFSGSAKCRDNIA
jgi:hypothetical protein